VTEQEVSTVKIRRILNRAEEEVDRHTEPPHPRDRKHMPHGRTDRESLHEEQVAEAAQPVTASGPPHMTGGQWKGMVLGGLAGGLVGAVILLPFALIPFMDPASGRVLLVVIVGWLAGATAGAVFWGGRTPELEHETVDVDGRPSIGTTMRNPRTDRRGRSHGTGHDTGEADSG
jgi:hypothetical protein